MKTRFQKQRQGMNCAILPPCVKVFLLFYCTIGLADKGMGQSLEWANSVGNVGLDLGISIGKDAFGNVYTTGYFEGSVDADPEPTTFYLTSEGELDFFLIKIDDDGNFLWARRFGGKGNDLVHALTIDDFGNVYLTGVFDEDMAFNIAGNPLSYTSLGQDDIFVLKLNNDGMLMWVKRMGGPNADAAFAIDVDQAGNVYTTGYYKGTSDFDPGAGISNLTASGEYDVFISKLDINGDFVWCKSIGGEGFEKGTTIKVNDDGDVYTAGYFKSTADFDPGAGTYELSALGLYDCFISKLDSNGQFIWAKRIGGLIDDVCFGLALDVSGNIVYSGFFGGIVDFDASEFGVYTITAAAQDIFVSKIDNAGNFLWAKNMGGTGAASSGLSIDTDASGDIYTAGYFTATVDFDPGTDTTKLSSHGQKDIFISKLASNGDYRWAVSMGGSSHDECSNIKLDASGNIYAAGWYASTVDFDPSNGVANLTSNSLTFDAFFLKMNQTSTASDEIQPASEALIYPNPASEWITVQSIEKLQSISIFNPMGDLVQTETSYKFSVAQLPAGLYILQIKTIGGLQNLRFIKI